MLLEQETWERSTAISASSLSAVTTNWWGMQCRAVSGGSYGVGERRIVDIHTNTILKIVAICEHSNWFFIDWSLKFKMFRGIGAWWSQWVNFMKFVWCSRKYNWRFYFTGIIWSLQDPWLFVYWPHWLDRPDIQHRFPSGQPPGRLHSFLKITKKNLFITKYTINNKLQDKFNHSMSFDWSLSLPPLRM